MLLNNKSASPTLNISSQKPVGFTLHKFNNKLCKLSGTQTSQNWIQIINTNINRLGVFKGHTPNDGLLKKKKKSIITWLNATACCKLSSCDLQLPCLTLVSNLQV